ncbi:hypothetical protein EJB05_53147 [Eragrostis curvula]|uniref:rRNA N-glycosylase n=1 Tax=Eragrostis curvula TaxID=38414 RepID=A0A5J9SQY3_9POAL|nr:hypothetical protein EJB05_53147 [Eragrostis curvula]
MKMKAPAAAVILVLLLAAVRGGCTDDNLTEWQTNEAKTVEVALDVGAGPERYKAFMNEVQRQLGATTTRPPIQKRPVLGAQRYKPDVWINVALKGNGGESATLAIRADNVYLVGFKAQAGWYAFKGKDSLIKESTPLNFGDDYNALTGGSSKLAAVAVGKKSAQEALSILAKYNKASTAEKEVKMALTRFVLMICEAARLVPVREDVISAWEQGGTVRKVGVEITVKWKVISCALLIWEKTKKWNNKDATEIKGLGDPKMVDAESAAKNVYFIIQPTPASPCSD